MKTKIKLILIITGFILTSISKLSAQGCFSNLIGGPNRTEIQSVNGFLVFTKEPAINPCNTATGTTMTGIGINQTNPAYILDILGNYTGDGVNVADGGSNKVGYSIGSQIVLWHAGITNCIYVGVGAGNTNTVTNCTFVGNNAGNSNATNDNTAVGYAALLNNTGGAGYGNQNVAIGNDALTTVASSLNIANVGSNNTAIGWSALKSFNPHHLPAPNTAVGSQSLFKCDTGWDNTTEGYLSGYSVTEGYENVAVGHQAMYRNAKGGADVAVGYFALFHDTIGDNTATGWNALYTNNSGSNNVA